MSGCSLRILGIHSRLGFISHTGDMFPVKKTEKNGFDSISVILFPFSTEDDWNDNQNI